MTHFYSRGSRCFIKWDLHAGEETWCSCCDCFFCPGIDAWGGSEIESHICSSYMYLRCTRQKYAIMPTTCTHITETALSFRFTQLKVNSNNKDAWAFYVFQIHSTVRPNRFHSALRHNSSLQAIRKKHLFLYVSSVKAGFNLSVDIIQHSFWQCKGNPMDQTRLEGLGIMYP